MSHKNADEFDTLSPLYVVWNRHVEHGYYTRIPAWVVEVLTSKVIIAYFYADGSYGYAEVKVKPEDLEPNLDVEVWRARVAKIRRRSYAGIRRYIKPPSGESPK